MRGFILQFLDQLFHGVCISSCKCLFVYWNFISILRSLRIRSEDRATAFVFRISYQTYGQSI